ncbi:DUF6958 family protein [Litorimonas sp. WD9-15]|uniref:DUF6958 family protein n=1 Tax=Litorimonas sp. WD9-15 TaxID=3418716 RepID=UPI003D02A6A3
MANTDSDKVECRTPTQGRKGTTQIPRWKYECIQRAILEALEEAETGYIYFKHLNAAVEEALTTNQLAKLGSLGWHVTTVKLNMEVEGEIVRVEGAKPQRLMKARL